MFEDLNQKKGQVPAPIAAPKPAGIVPPRQNLSAPIGTTSSAPKIEDMFASVKDVPLPKNPPSGGAPAMPGIPLKEKKKSSGNGLRNFVIIIIILAVLGAAVFLAGRFFNSPALSQVSDKMAYLKSLIIKEKSGATIVVNNEKPAVPAVENQENVNPPAATVPADITPAPAESTPAATTTPTPETPSVPAAVATTTVPAVDTDSDGLTDSEESALGTNPLKPDTDDDGLTDFQEVKNYKTDPLKADTDGDGYLDGAEVKSGYNPLGAGKLQ